MHDSDDSEDHAQPDWLEMEGVVQHICKVLLVSDADAGYTTTEASVEFRYT